MRKIKTPRILRIIKIEQGKIYVTFNNGEERVIDFARVLTEVGVNESSPAGVLFDLRELKKVRLNNATLSFNNVIQFITLKSGIKERVPFEIGADVLYGMSEPFESGRFPRLGQLIREARQKAGMTQEELASRSGTSRTYISRIENDKSDIEVSTLTKIVEIGLGRELDIHIK